MEKIGDKTETKAKGEGNHFSDGTTLACLVTMPSDDIRHHFESPPSYYHSAAIRPFLVTPDAFQQNQQLHSKGSDMIQL